MKTMKRPYCRLKLTHKTRIKEETTDEVDKYSFLDWEEKERVVTSRTVYFTAKNDRELRWKASQILRNNRNKIRNIDFTWLHTD